MGFFDGIVMVVFPATESTDDDQQTDNDDQGDDD
jgi:hypothetical protein